MSHNCHDAPIVAANTQAPGVTMKQETQRTYIEAKGLPTRRLLELALREGNSKLPVYKMHKWWARRLGSVVRAILLGLLLPEKKTETEYWDAYFNGYHEAEVTGKPRPTILDPFMGGGSSLVEARRLNLNCIGFDIDPMAWFVTRQEMSTVDLDDLDKAFEQVRGEAQSKVASFYKTTIESGEERDVIYYFWVRTLVCPDCKGIIELHPHYQLERRRKNNKQICFCASCHEIQELPNDVQILTCESCGVLTTIQRGNVDRYKVRCSHCERNWPRKQLREEQGFGGVMLFALQYLESGDQNRLVKRFKKADEFDQVLFRMAEGQFSSVAQTFPVIKTFLDTFIPSEGRNDPRPISYGFIRYAELFNGRQLFCLGTILKAILNVKEEPLRELLLLAFSDSLASNNMMCYYAFDYDKLTPLFGLHGYNVVTRPVENNVWGTSLGRGTFRNCYAKMVKGLHYMRNTGRGDSSSQPYAGAKNNDPSGGEANRLSSAAAGLLQELTIDLRRASGDNTRLTAHSVDLILTDPPYFDNLHYGEMSDFYYAWLSPVLNGRYPEEFRPPDCVTIADRIHGNGDPDSVVHFKTGLAQVFSECKRVLKEEGIMALTFHHRREEAWLALYEALTEAGFRIVEVVPVRSEGRSGFHSSPGNLKWDAVIVCRPSTLGPLSHQKQEFDVQHRLRQWKQELMELDGCPSEDDWRSLGLAVKCLARHNNSGET